MIYELSPDKLKFNLDEKKLKYKTTEKLIPLKEIIGQDRAVKDKTFHIYTVKTIDEGIEILTGVKAGKRLASGKFSKNTINYKVNKRIKEFADKLSKLSESGKK
ncbi:MAG: hypothetical protein WA120_00685 [Candidatus Hydromicrobium sp.]